MDHNMIHNLNSLEGALLRGLYYTGATKGEARNLDYGSYGCLQKGGIESPYGGYLSGVYKADPHFWKPPYVATCKHCKQIAYPSTPVTLSLMCSSAVCSSLCCMIWHETVEKRLTKTAFLVIPRPSVSRGHQPICEDVTNQIMGCSRPWHMLA